MEILSNFVPGDETIDFVSRLNVVQGTTLCVTVATSVVATLVIGVRIYTSTARNHQARERYKHIVEIIVQSSALYSISLLISAVNTLCDNSGDLTASQSVAFNADSYAYGIAAVATVYSSPFFPMNSDLLVIISLGICPHSNGCSARAVKRQNKRGIFNEHDVRATGFSPKCLRGLPTASQHTRN